MKCEHLHPTPDPDVDVPCGLRAVAAWSHATHGTVILCKRHDDKAIRRAVEGWVRVAELPALVTA
jgi:hypothetical protein